MKVFLDLDGPILDNAPKYYAIYTDLLGAAGYTPLRPDEYWELKRRRVPEEEILRHTCPDEFAKEYLAERLARIEEFRYLLLDRVTDAACERLGEWAGRHDLYLVTLRKHRDTLLAQLRHLRLMDYFRDVCSEDNNDGSWQVKLRLLRNRTHEGNDAVMIGDTETDITAGRALGIRTIAVTCGIRTRELLEAAKPDQIARSLADVEL